MSIGVNKGDEAFGLTEMHRDKLPLSAEQPLYVHHHVLCKPMGPYYNMHYAVEFLLVLSGRMKCHYRDWQITLDAGQIGLCGIWEPHGFCTLEVPCQNIIFSILPEMLAMTRLPEAAFFDWLAPFTVPPQKRPRVNAVRSDYFLSLGRRALDILGKKGKIEGVLLRLLLLEIIIELCNDWSLPAPAGTISSDSFAMINKAVEMIFKSRELITVHEASKVCGLRKRTFAKLFHEVMGISFADFSLRYRLDGTKEQLVRSHDPLKTISTAWGFTDKSHFHHQFVQHYGCTPNEFRKRYARRFPGRLDK